MVDNLEVGVLFSLIILIFYILGAHFIEQYKVGILMLLSYLLDRIYSWIRYGYYDGCIIKFNYTFSMKSDLIFIILILVRCRSP